MTQIKPTMKLITAPWNDQRSFRLMPVSLDCPFSEGIYDPDGKVLVMMSVVKKQSYHMLPKLDDNGDPIRAKTERMNRKVYKEERKALETFNETYITEKNEIIELIKDLAINADTYDYTQYLTDKKVIVPEKKIELIN